MFVKDLYVKMNQVVTVNKTQSTKEVYGKLKESGYRCIPVVSEAGNYEGMIFKVHLLEYFHEKGDSDDSIEKLITHQGQHIEGEEPFIQAVLKIKALPFLPVVEEGKLKGILTHNKVMGVLEDSFGLKTGGISFTVSAFETTGVVEKLGNILKNENIEGFLSLDNGSKLVRRIVFTVKNESDSKQVERINKKVEKAGLRVIHTEFL